MLLPNLTPVVKAMDDRVVAVMRMILAASAMLVAYVDLPAPDSYVVATYVTLGLYFAYSVILYMLARRHGSLLLSMAHWVDTGWYGVLIGLSGGTNSIFFFFFFFAILVTSFQWGFASGFGVTLVAAVLFMTVGLTMTPPEPMFELSRFLLRPVCLLVLGYMMAFWGGTEIKLKQRLALLKDVGRFANPRFGVDQTLSMLMQRLRAFYDADACLIIAADHTTGAHNIRRADRCNPEASARAVPIPAELAQLLLALPAAQGLVYGGVPYLQRWWRPPVATQAREPGPDGERVGPAQISSILTAESFLTVPFHSGGEIVGRLYLTSPRRRVFEDTDIDFLLHVLDYTMPVLDTIQLVDRLTSDAAKMERQRLARNLHDGVIQPCMGLRLGLTAIKQKFLLAGTEAGKELERLVNLSDAALADLRHCIGELRGSVLQDDLLVVLRQLGQRFAKATGIAVHVEAEVNLELNNRLTAEVLQMMAEGLSNVRRHTRSTWATVGLTRHDGRLTVRIENDAGDQSPTPFTPRSIAERAAALGGHARVTQTDTGRTVVFVDVPL